LSEHPEIGFLHIPVGLGTFYFGFGREKLQRRRRHLPTILNLFVFWLWELPLAYVLAVVFHFGLGGVFLAITIAFSTLAVVSAIFFIREGSGRQGLFRRTHIVPRNFNINLKILLTRAGIKSKLCGSQSLRVSHDV